MKTLRQILLPVLALTLIAACMSAALAATNALTAGIIADRAQQAADAARRQVISADRFEELSLGDTGQDKITCFRAVTNGQTAGYVFTAVTSGKSAGLTVMTGILADGTVSGVVITQDNETAGYVDNVTKGGLPSSFVWQKAGVFELGKHVDKVSNATKTSKGIIAAVNLACRYYEKIKEGA